MAWSNAIGEYGDQWGHNGIEENHVDGIPRDNCGDAIGGAPKVDADGGTNRAKVEPWGAAAKARAGAVGPSAL